MQRNIPTAYEMEEFFAYAEKQQQAIFMDKCVFFYILYFIIWISSPLYFIIWISSPFILLILIMQYAYVYIYIVYILQV